MARALRPVLVCLALVAPALAVRLLGVQLSSPFALLVFGVAVVAAAFALAWAAEAAELDISGGLAVALLAVVVVLPEYAVDLYFAFKAGAEPEFVQYAAANMTGSNRLLLGLGWPAVVILSLAAAGQVGPGSSRRPSAREVVLEPRYRTELGFLLVASLAALLIPLSGQIHLLLGVALFGFFAFYLLGAARRDPGDAEQHDLVGPAARIGALPAAQRRLLVVAMFAGAATAILASAEPFAHALVGAGAAAGLDPFLLVQWLAPLASETPEFVVAILFAARGKAGAALGMLISAKVNQWTLLVGSLPIAYVVGGGSTALVLDARQVEEVLLTAAQTVLGVAILLALRFPLWAGWTLLGLFAVQFAIPGTAGRLAISGVYALLAAALLVRHRARILPTLAAPFRRAPRPIAEATPERVGAGR